MDRSHELLQNEDLHLRCGEMIKDNIVAIERQIFLLRDHLAARKKGIISEIRSSGNEEEEEGKNLKTALHFYDHALEELVKVEEVCEQYLISMKLDLLAEARGRLDPPYHTDVSRVRRAYDSCADVLEKLQDETSASCRCTWTNIPESVLENTRDVLAKPRPAAPTAFDESDLKFKQELIELRAKVFPALENAVKTIDTDDPIKGIAKSQHGRPSYPSKDFIEIVEKRESYSLPSGTDELFKMNSLKFTDGEHTACDIWARILDTHGERMRSKWHFAMCPEIRRIMQKRRIPTLHLNPVATFAFLKTIPETGFNFLLTKEDLIGLVDGPGDDAWLRGWRPQFKSIESHDIAAVLIQSFWRGYWLRKEIRYSNCRYVAASVLWFAWVSLKKTRQMHEHYLTKIRVSLAIARELCAKLSEEFPRLIKAPHVVLILPSLGYPLDIRRTYAPRVFAVHQNTTILKMSFLRNPMSELIYVLPVAATEDLLSMYEDTIASVGPRELAARVTFLSLSEAKTFEHRAMNVARLLHCSEETLESIRTRIAGRPVYILPWWMDECDVRLADKLNAPLLGPDMELQERLLNFSRLSATIEALGLRQPAHARDLRDYASICERLARLIAANTEVCSWLIKLNYGVRSRHSGTFLINHISVPFMPILRKERELHGDDWLASEELRSDALDSLREQLPRVLSKVTRLSNAYGSWREFYAHVQKFGCLVQAVPNERNASNVIVSLFVPGRATGAGPKWCGTADKVFLDSKVGTYVYMIPQSALNVRHLAPAVNRLAEAMQHDGYLGYMTIDCYCYPHEHEENLAVSILEVHPYYTHAQNYIDWVKFAVNGWYSYSANTMNTDIFPDSRWRAKYVLPVKSPKWHETTERHAIAISRLYHTSLPCYRWPDLKTLLDDCGIRYNAETKEGCHVVLHDGETRNSAIMTVISASMQTTLSMADCSLKKLYRTLRRTSPAKPITNLKDLANFFSKLSLTWRNLSLDPCV